MSTIKQVIETPCDEGFCFQFPQYLPEKKSEELEDFIFLRKKKRSMPPIQKQKEVVELPVSSFLCGKISPQWEVIKPLFLKIERDEDGRYMVTDDISEVYGIGDTSSNALQDYITSIIEYYELLSTQTEADESTRMLFRHLQHYLRKIDEFNECVYKAFRSENVQRALEKLEESFDPNRTYPHAVKA